MQEAKGLQGDDPTARRELFQQKCGASLLVVRIDHAGDLGAARGQLDPTGVRPFGQRGGHRCRRIGRTADPHRPVRATQSLTVELADHPDSVLVAHPTVAAGNRLLRSAQDLRHPAERHPPVDVERVDDSVIQLIEDGGFHVRDAR